MAISVFKSWISGEVLSASDLNSSFTQITGNGEDLGWPATKSKDMDGNELVLDADGDSSLHVSTDDQLDLKLQGVDAFIFDGTTASIVNGMTFGATATGTDPTITAQGTDTNIGINLVTKGTGTIKHNGVTVAGMDIISSGSASAVASVEFTGLTSAYQAYKLIFEGCTPATDGTNLSIQFSDDNGSTWMTTVGDYHWSNRWNDAGAASIAGSTNDSRIYLVANNTSQGSTAGEEGCGEVILYNPSSATDRCKLTCQMTFGQTTGDHVHSDGSGMATVDTAIDAFRILYVSGNIAAVNYTLYGLKK